MWCLWACVYPVFVSSRDEVLRCLDEGQKNRATSATLMNAGSSRSHALLMVQIMQRDSKTMRSKRAKLCKSRSPPVSVLSQSSLASHSCPCMSVSPGRPCG